MSEKMDFLEVLHLERIEDDLFRGRCHQGAPQRAFGGQVAAQALVAAGRTVPADRTVHSLHSYFIRAGRADSPIVYGVDRTRDGASFTTRRVVAIQNGKTIFSLSASFHAPEPGLDHQSATPTAPPPEESAPAPDRWSFFTDAIEIRLATESAEETAPRRQMWVRARDPLGPDPLLNACALTYISDIGLAGTIPLGRHPEGTPLLLTSLDHALWFHRPFTLDTWLLFDTSSPTLTPTRGLAHGTFHTRSGTLVASVTQEALLRPHHP
ncbi:acyl-CoA thioesterase-2 [Actinocorallia herbida]|uniref:Acyl-CoA thioesterase 2 n=1 Tax=Actinocorallia herbida TaxID=58109 RepID=A0A3N1CT47_9ACTN|nr:acyl-CoA thioesterase domain-containing protein [Actinocorallia herbida]ROO84476.1 acyl-CoA thioesterase-2 [Actinocorallia herbida]